MPEIDEDEMELKPWSLKVGEGPRSRRDEYKSSRMFRLQKPHAA